jgi:hypothetical protein
VSERKLTIWENGLLGKVSLWGFVGVLS